MPGRPLIGARARRRAGWCALLLAVCVAHWWLAAQMPDSRFGEGAAEDDAPKAIEVAFVSELAPAAPPRLLATPPPLAHARPAKRLVAIEAPVSAASSPSDIAASA